MEHRIYRQDKIIMALMGSKSQYKEFPEKEIKKRAECIKLK